MRITVYIATLSILVACKTSQVATISESNQPSQSIMIEEIKNDNLPIAKINKKVEKNPFETAFQSLKKMLEDKEKYSFKKAVFVTESAYYGGSLSYLNFNKEIEQLVSLVQFYRLINEKKLEYDQPDRANITTWASTFKVMTDTIQIIYDDSVYTSFPYSYDFSDVWGINNWESMFVTKLLRTKKGNCHSLPYLYKIVSEELGAPAHLSIAPNHIYLKHRSKLMGMYNTELTSATFPIDAWLMASGYVHLDAVRNGIYMEALDDKQSIALCMVDLAKGYERKYGYTGDTFLMKCLDTALAYYPNCINALLFKSEVIKRQLDNETEANKKQRLFTDFEALIVKIHRLGYRKMPESMYLKWLFELEENKAKYENKKIAKQLNPENNLPTK